MIVLSGPFKARESCDQTKNVASPIPAKDIKMSITHPSFGKLDDDRIIIFDTTLRDGEQSPGFSMNINEKIRMAEALAALGVDVLEAGFPAASPGDFEA